MVSPRTRLQVVNQRPESSIFSERHITSAEGDYQARDGAIQHLGEAQYPLDPVVNRQQGIQHLSSSSSSYQPYNNQQQQQQQLLTFNNNALQNAQSSLLPAVPDAGESQAQMMHTPVYMQQQQQLLGVPATDAESGNYQITNRQIQQPKEQQQHENPKKRQRRRTGAAEATTTANSSSELDMPAATVIDRVPSGKERRRTQMRIAQRAYRQRKQNELSSRAQQLSEKDNIIAQMKIAFDSLNSRLTGSDALSLYPELSQPVADMANAFEALSQMATVSNATGSGGQGGNGTRAKGMELPSRSKISSSAGRPDQQDQQWTNSGAFANNNSDQQQQPNLDITNLATTPYIAAGPTQMLSLQSFSDPFLHGQQRRSMVQAFPVEQYPSNVGDRLNNTKGPIITGSMALPTPTYLRPPKSYSFQETTFARRLMRTCLQSASNVLLYGPSPKEARIFKLAYRLWSKEYLAEKLQLALSSGGDLFDPSIPFVPLGGAGTHYIHNNKMTGPGTGQQPQRQSAPSSVTHGPLATHSAHIRHEGPDTSLNGIVTALGLQNDEWFDAQDIDCYLREMGINLEAHTSYYRFSLPANPNVASRSINTSMPQAAPAPAADAQEYIPAVVDVDRFLDCKLIFLSLSLSLFENPAPTNDECRHYLEIYVSGKSPGVQEKGCRRAVLQCDRDVMIAVLICMLCEPVRIIFFFSFQFRGG